MFPSSLFLVIIKRDFITDYLNVPAFSQNFWFELSVSFIRAGVSVLDSTRQVSNLGNDGVPVHHDPVDGIVANPGNREWARRPLSFFVVCEHPIHRVMVNWDPPMAAAAAIKFY